MEQHEALEKVTNIIKKNNMTLLRVNGVDVIDMPDGLKDRGISAGNYISVSVDLLIRGGDAKQERIPTTGYNPSRSEDWSHKESHEHKENNDSIDNEIKHVVAKNLKYAGEMQSDLDGSLFLLRKSVNNVSEDAISSAVNAIYLATQVEPEIPATPEQQARDLLERIGIEGAQDFSAGELVELVNLIQGI